MNSSGRLTRSNTDRIVAGVCGGIANYLKVDPMLVRLAFVLLVWLGGVSPLIYLILWAVLPTEATMNQGFSQQVRQNLSEMEERATSVATKVGGHVNQLVGGNRTSQSGQTGQSSPGSGAQQGDGPATGPTRRL